MNTWQPQQPQSPQLPNAQTWRPKHVVPGIPLAHAYYLDGTVCPRFCANCGRDLWANPVLTSLGPLGLGLLLPSFRKYGIHAGWHGEGSAGYCSKQCLEQREGVHPLDARKWTRRLLAWLTR